MKRRQFIAFVAGAVVACPLGAGAQPARRQARVGILNYFDARYSRVAEFTESLRELGYIEGQNLVTIHRWADGQLNRLPGLAAELAASKIDVMIALGPAAWAARQTTATIPIVTTFSGDPVGMGLISNLARPGGNVTGFSYMSTDLAAKRLGCCTRSIQPIPISPRSTTPESLQPSSSWNRRNLRHARSA